MHQFTVPQFIDVEDKIIGPVTTRQFIIMITAGFFIFVFYKLLAFGPFVFLSVFLFGVAATVAFVRINGQPFHFFLINIMQTTRSPNLRVWDKTLTASELKTLMARKPPLTKISPTPVKEVLNTSRLSEIALTVDTGGVYTPD